MKVIIQGNGAVKVNGRYVFYKKGEPVELPENAAKRTGREYKVISRSETTVIAKQDVEKREPEHVGGGYYLLSNGEKVRGKKKAIEAESKL